MYAFLVPPRSIHFGYGKVFDDPSFSFVARQIINLTGLAIVFLNDAEALHIDNDFTSAHWKGNRTNQ